VPYIHSEARRHKFKKQQYKVTNWPDCNAALTAWRLRDVVHRRGDSRVVPAKTGVVAGGLSIQCRNRDRAVLRQFFHMALRQIEDFMNPLARALKAEISIPDFSCI
jgi:hypothetical protein